MRVAVIRKTLKLTHAFTISRGTKTENESLFVKLSHNGVDGWGEASPNRRYNETPESAMGALADMIDVLPEAPTHYHDLSASLAQVAKGQYAALSAMDMALMDYLGKRLNTPLYELFGLDPHTVVPTSYTISMDDPVEMAKRAREITDFQHLKIKLGGTCDRDMIKAVRSVTDLPIRVDANEGWQDREQAAKEIDWLATQNVIFVEQPMPASALEDMVWLKQRSALPLMADEAVRDQKQLFELREGFHGVNLKLQKSGGLTAVREYITIARALGLKIMLGCMVESSLGIAAAIHLSPLADYLDLDGHHLIANNPFDGLRLEDGRVLPSSGPGLGMTPNEEIVLPDLGDDFDRDDF